MPLIEINIGELVQESEAFLLVAEIPSFDIYSSDSVFSSDTQIRELNVRDSGSERDTSLTSWSTYSYDLPTGSETDLLIREDSDSPVSGDISLVSWTIFSNEQISPVSQVFITRLLDDLFSGREAQVSLVSFINSSSITDFVLAAENQLPIISNLDPGFVHDSNINTIFLDDISFSLSTNVKSITSVTESSTTQQVLASDAQLPIFLNSDILIYEDADITEIQLVDLCQEFDIQVPFGSIFVGELELAQEYDISFRTIFGSDEFFFFDQTLLTSNIPPPSTNTLVDVYVSILNLLNATGIFGPNSVNFVIDPDSVIMWPSDPPPFALLEPLDLTDLGDAQGGGRFSKTWDCEIAIHIVAENFEDQAYKDTIVTTSEANDTGPYQIVQNVINLMEQSYPVDAQGRATVIELPFFLGIDPIRRYKGSNIFTGIPIKFKVTFRENLPLQLP